MSQNYSNPDKKGIPGENVGFVKMFLLRNLADIKTRAFWTAVSAEFLGTLLLCIWAIGATLHMKETPAPPLVNVALCVGFMMATLITCLTNVSGGHVNPALSIGYLVTGQITLARFLLYVIAQSVSCVMALMTLRYMVPLEMMGMMGLMIPGQGVTPLMAFTCEFYMGFLLLFGIMAMTDSKRSDVKGSVPLFVGLIVASNILMGGRISGGSMNPALSFGPAILSGFTDLQWVYWLGPLLGGASGALTYDKAFSVTALSKPICPCSKSRDSDVTADIEDEEVMLQDKV